MPLSDEERNKLARMLPLTSVGTVGEDRRWLCKRLRELDEEYRTALALNDATIKTLRLVETDNARLRAYIDDMPNWSPFSSRPCPMCEYESGKFISNCYLHEEVARLRELLRTAMDAVDHETGCDEDCWVSLRQDVDKALAGWEIEADDGEVVLTLKVEQREVGGE